MMDKFAAKLVNVDAGQELTLDEETALAIGE